MGIVQKNGVRAMIISYVGMILGYLNKGVLFLIILSTEQIGLISLLTSVGILFAQFAQLGTNSAVWRFFPFFKNDTNRNNGFLPLVLLTVIFGIVLCTLFSLIFRGAIAANYNESSELFVDFYLWFIPIGIGYALYIVLEIYLRAMYKIVISVFAMDIIFRLIVLILLLLLWGDLISFSDFVALHAIAFGIPAVILFLYLYKIGELNLSVKTIKISRRFRKILIQFSAFSYVNTLSSTIVNSLDVLMIAQFYGLGPTGVYATVVFLTSFLRVPYHSILRASTPLIADHWKNQEMGKLKELYRKVSSVSLVAGFAPFLIIWLNIDLLFSFLKPEFQDGIWVFFFLMMGRMFDMYFGLNGAIFSTSKKYRYDILFTLFLIFAVFFLNLLLIPIGGISGAAISTALALIFYNVGRLLFVWKVYKIHPFERNQFIVIGLGVVTLLLGWLLGDVFSNKWLQLMLDTVLFVIAFIVPIYVFSLEMESITYFKKSLKYVKKRIKKKA